jgi:hypothetical protein
MVAELPGHVRLETPDDVLDQRTVGRCVAESLARGMEVLAMRAGYAVRRPSRRDLYWRCRAALGLVGEDSGAMIRDGVAIVREGWEDETEEPSPVFDASYLTPPAPLPPDAPRLVNSEPLVIGDDASCMYELAMGHPLVVGVQLTAQWNFADGEDLIGDPEGDGVGGHAMLITGYRTDGERVQYHHDGSWGPNFGRGGRIWISSKWLSLGRCGEVFALRGMQRPE